MEVSYKYWYMNIYYIHLVLQKWYTAHIRTDIDVEKESIAIRACVHVLFQEEPFIHPLSWSLHNLMLLTSGGWIICFHSEISTEYHTT